MRVSPGVGAAVLEHALTPRVEAELWNLCRLAGFEIDSAVFEIVGASCCDDPPFRASHVCGSFFTWYA